MLTPHCSRKKEERSGHLVAVSETVPLNGQPAVDVYDFVLGAQKSYLGILQSLPATQEQKQRLEKAIQSLDDSIRQMDKVIEDAASEWERKQDAQDEAEMEQTY